MEVMRARFAIGVLVIAVVLACAVGVCAKPMLEPGERMVFLGDSITQQQIYTRYVTD